MTWYEILFLKYLKGLPSKARMFLKLAKGGTMQLLPVNDDEPETSPFKGVIRYPDTSSDVEEEFTYKQSSYTGQARIKSIKGNTLVWNQLVNGMVTSSADGITTAYNSSTNVITITNNSRTTNYGTGSTRGNINTITITSGHKYLFCIDNVVTGVIVTHDTGSGLHDITFNSTYTATTGTGNFRLRITKDYDFVTAHPVNSVVSIKIMCIDLTILNDSHITDYNSFKTYFPLNYYAYGQYLLNFNGTGIKTTGKNLLDSTNLVNELGTAWDGSERTIQGVKWKAYFNDEGFVTKIVADGNANGNASQVGINFTLPRTGNYYFGLMQPTNNSVANMYLWDLDTNARPKNWDGTGNAGNCTSMSPTGFKYVGNRMRIQCRVQGSVSNLEFYPCVFLADETDWSFEPYTTSTTSLPISTYFTNGMKSAGTIYDELSDKAITRVGNVDLGSLEWVLNDATYHIFRAEISNMKAYTPWTGNKNLLTPNYAITTESKATMPDMTIRQASDNTQAIYMKNNSYSDATTFKSAMSGVYLNYELATYTEQDVDPEDTQIMLNRALSTVLGRNVSVDNPQEALDILTKGE